MPHLCWLAKTTITFLVALLVFTCISAQSFHREVSQPLNYMSQKLVRGEQGLYYIADSFLSNGELVLSAFHECGDSAWSQSYIVEGTFVELVDMKTTSAGDLLLYGSYFFGNEELIFLQKVDALTGVLISFNTYDPIFQDHFTYSLDVRSGSLIIYGLLLDFNIDRRCFIAEFDESLNLRWAKSFKPFEKEGEAVIAADGIMGRSEKFHFMLDAEGKQVWSHELQADNESFLPIGGPVRSGSHFLYEARVNDENFFYLLNSTGDLLWHTDLFPSVGNRSSIVELEAGGFHIVYYHLEAGELMLAMMELDMDGEITQHMKLITEGSFAPGSLKHFFSDGSLTVAGSPDPFSNAGTAYQDFHMRLDDEVNECFSWEPVQNMGINTVSLTQLPYDFATEDLGLTNANPQRVARSPSLLTYEELCTSVETPTKREELLSINCGEEKEIQLPEGFIWDDLLTREVRQVSSPETFVARSEECLQLEFIEYIVNQPSCDCELYVPNIFSPNSDGVNDKLKYASSCALLSVEVQIYNRWGERVYKNNVVGQYWGAEKSPPGLYVMLIDYEVADNEGNISQNQKVQDIQLVR